MKEGLLMVGAEIINFGRLVDENDRGDVRVVKTDSGYEARWVKIHGL